MAVYSSLEIANKDDSCEEDDGRPKRTGTIWTCNAHIITGVIGSGILSLAWSTAQLGWVAGPISMVSFAIVTYVSASLLSDCYRSPDPVTGIRNYTYVDAVNAILGQKRSWLCGYLQYLSMFGGCVAYVITASISIGAIHRSNCYHKQGHEAPCVFGDTFYMLLFGAIQVVFSQIPNFHHMEWLSIMAAIMSFTYATIGFSLGFFRVIENGSIMGSLGGVPQATTAQKFWKICQAVGDIAFSYPYTGILLEIQDTLPSPPAENKTMKEASKMAISITTFFYLFCGCFGYAAFGNQTPGNLLTGFGFYEPYWLIDLANVCIIVHLVGGYQVFSQLQILHRQGPFLLNSSPPEPSQAALSNSICSFNNSNCNDFSILQPSSGSIRYHFLLALDYIFPSSDVLCAAQGLRRGHENGSFFKFSALFVFSLVQLR